MKTAIWCYFPLSAGISATWPAEASRSRCYRPGSGIWLVVGWLNCQWGLEARSGWSLRPPTSIYRLYLEAHLAAFGLGACIPRTSLDIKHQTPSPGRFRATQPIPHVTATEIWLQHQRAGDFLPQGSTSGPPPAPAGPASGATQLTQKSSEGRGPLSGGRPTGPAEALSFPMPRKGGCKSQKLKS